ncbi:hypothetical protein Tco_0695651 [Tanacetum coccineum]
MAVTLTKKIFGNMKKGFRGAPRPLLSAMLLVATTNPNVGQEHHAITQSQPSASTLPYIHNITLSTISTPIPASIPTPTPIPETEPAPFEHTFEEPISVSPTNYSPPQERLTNKLTMDDLLQVVLISQESEELKGFYEKEKYWFIRHLKRKNLRSKGEEKIKMILLASCTRTAYSFNDKSEVHRLIWEVRYKRRKETKGKKVVSSLVFQEEVDTGAKEVNTAEGVNTGSIKLSTVSEQVSTGSAKRSIPSPDKGQRAGKAPMIIEETPKKCEPIAPINFEATKASLKRFGEELQTKTTKRLKDDEAKDAEPAKKSGKRRKQMARKGLHTDLDKDDSEDSDEVTMKSPSIATYKIIKQGEKGLYQIVREDGTDTVYINFGAMLKDNSIRE